MQRGALSATVACTLTLLIAPEALAQLAEAPPIVYSHHRIYASSMVEQKRFWVDTLGGHDAGQLGAAPMDVIRFPNVQVIISVRKPTDGTVGSVVNHVAFQVPRLADMAKRVTVAGYSVVTRQALPPSIIVKDDVGFSRDE